MAEAAYGLDIENSGKRTSFYNRSLFNDKRIAIIGEAARTRISAKKRKRRKMSSTTKEEVLLRK